MDEHNKSVCQRCFRSYVCEQFNENKDDDNKNCHFFNDHFVPIDDVVKVVRCKDCIHWGGLTYGFVCRKFSGIDTKICMGADHFCSYGTPKERGGEK